MRQRCGSGTLEATTTLPGGFGRTGHQLTVIRPLLPAASRTSLSKSGPTNGSPPTSTRSATLTKKSVSLLTPLGGRPTGGLRREALPSERRTLHQSECPGRAAHRARGAWRYCPLEAPEQVRLEQAALAPAAVPAAPNGCPVASTRCSILPSLCQRSLQYEPRHE